uniref:Uncharacterized protein n=1 Tax=Chromera velia CCMP2878 TaxID=1169474 RepID=A0A0G4GP79_9ALVE|eukprot:Cvel_22762.t1-p1 / transcript=Cvel_22762.t1 / gene=Cvel_22762 / organism=Chromera_velia_CCMP2878 / gene_product=hypothetical protein / transcript_product=hypothetical protein / location=Cvel_scaffold2273:18059-22233(+) / protein_length=216 / sequence_SO=supercontig / SO=protein_coding / is_pseudo=false
MSGFFCACCEGRGSRDQNQIVMPRAEIDEKTQNVNCLTSPDALHESQNYAPVTSEPVELERDAMPSPTKAMTAEAKEMEKERLQQMVKDFAKTAVRGQPCEWLNCESGERRQAIYSIDKTLKLFSMTPVIDSEPSRSLRRSLEMSQISSVQRETTGLSREVIDSLGPDEGERLIVLKYRNLDEQAQVAFLLPAKDEREKFLTCMKVLRWALEAKKY